MEEGRKFVKPVLRTVVWLLMGLTLAACGDASKQDILRKAAGADTKAKLEAAIGRPSEVDKLGPVEQWTYKASDGRVVFIITGDTVVLQTAGGKADN